VTQQSIKTEGHGFALVSNVAERSSLSAVLRLGLFLVDVALTGGQEVEGVKAAL
jgi:hypothetical protein